MGPAGRVGLLEEVGGAFAEGAAGRVGICGSRARAGRPVAAGGPFP